MFKFVPDHVGGVGTKRKQAQKSCEYCRKRHKRCGHNSASVSPRASELVEPIDSSDRHTEASRAETVQRRESYKSPLALEKATPSVLPQPLPPVRPLSKDAYLRFVGDLSPEASFLSNQRRTETSTAARHAEVGVWLGQRPDTQTAVAAQRENGSHGVEHSTAKGSVTQRPGLTSLHAISSQLRQECLSMLPPDYEFGIIVNLYRTKIDPVFPILLGEDLDSHAEMSSAALKQCICLAAALDPKLRRHLRLPHIERILSPIEFRAYVASAVKQALDMGLIQDNLVLLQVCALMAFCADQANCSEVSAHYVSQAVHHTQTLGLHLGWPDDGERTEKSRRIFWCIWILDRLNAAANGRPILIHRQDMDARIVDTFAEQSPPFKLHIRIAQFLDRVISRYRPQSIMSGKGLLDEDITFEDMVREADAADVGSAVLASLEIFYLAVVILRHRPQQTEREGLPVPSSDLQLFAAASIVAIASEDFKTSITFWPVVPYAVSLATSVAYKSLRNSIMVYRRKRAYGLFHNSCEVLDEMGKAFCSAKTIAKLAMDTMQEVERVAAGRSKARQLDRTVGSDQPTSQRDIVTNDSGTTAPVSSQVPVQSQRAAPEQPRHHPLESLALQQGISGGKILQNESPSIFDDFIGDAGIFNDFDPTFDLDRVDQLFSANLDPTQRLPAQGWTDNFHFE